MRTSGAALGLPAPRTADDVSCSAADCGSAGRHRGLLGAERVQLDLRSALVARDALALRRRRFC